MNVTVNAHFGLVSVHKAVGYGYSDYTVYVSRVKRRPFLEGKSGKTALEMMQWTDSMNGLCVLSCLLEVIEYHFSEGRRSMTGTLPAWHGTSEKPQRGS